MRKISSKSFIMLESQHFTSDNGVLVIFDLKRMFVMGHQDSDFQSTFYAFDSMLLSVKKVYQQTVQRFSQTNAKTNGLNL